MKYHTYSHMRADLILEENSDTSLAMKEVISVISEISEEELKIKFNNTKSGKSISRVLNDLLKDRLKSKYWIESALIYGDLGRDNLLNRVDYFKKKVVLNILTKHLGYLPGILVKNQFASSASNLLKEIEGEVGIVICPTIDLRRSGGFDGAVSTYEECISCLKMMENIITTPILVIGLDGLETFRINHTKEGNVKVGYVMEISNR